MRRVVVGARLGDLVEAGAVEGDRTGDGGRLVLVGVERVALVAELDEEHEDLVGALVAELDVLVLLLRLRPGVGGAAADRLLADPEDGAAVDGLRRRFAAEHVGHAWLRSAACFSASGLGSTWSELADCASPLVRLFAAGAAAVDGARVRALAPVMRARESPRVVDLTRCFLSERQGGGRDRPYDSLPCGP